MRASTLALMMLAACGAEQPPFAELPLRDALQAEPKALAHASVAERDVLRERFLAAMRVTTSDSHVVPLDETPPWVRFDARRLDLGRDAAPHVVISTGDGAATVSECATSYVRDAVLQADRPNIDTSRDDAATASLIETALHGAAGALLQTLSDGRAIVRADHTPFAIASDEKTLYVNPAWLVVMAEPLAGVPAGGIIRVSQQSAASVGTVVSIDGCVGDVDAACADCAKDASKCDDTVVLVDYATAQDECVAVLGNATVAHNVCGTLELNRADVWACMQRNEPSCLGGVYKSNTAWAAFSSKPLCEKVLSRCAADPKYVEQITCDACTNTCSKICNPTINCNTPSCGSSSSSTSSCKVCSSTPHEASIPAISIGFALLPLLYFARAMRRRRDER